MVDWYFQSNPVPVVIPKHCNINRLSEGNGSLKIKPIIRKNKNINQYFNKKETITFKRYFN